MPSSDLAAHMQAVAGVLWGEPNRHLSTPRVLRWGTHGARSVDLERGTWYDHEEKQGGGVLDLIRREAGLTGRDAFDWLSEHGFGVEDRRDPPGTAGRTDGAKGGAAPGSARPREADTRGERRRRGRNITATYDYHDEDENLLYQVVRIEEPGRPKTFRQRRPARPGDDPAKVRDGWVWSVRDCRLVPYRLPQLIEALGFESTVFIVEGEKDVDNLARHGVPATTNPMGAGKWPESFAEIFRGGDIVIIPDNDAPGREHRDLVAASLVGVARSVRILGLPGVGEKGDVSEWIEKCGGNVDRLYDLVEQRARPWNPGTDFQSRFQAVPWRQLDDPGPEHEWLIKGWLTRGERSMCAGPSQSGKSFLVLDIALAVARGIPWQGCRTLRGGVVYQAGEGGRGIKKRLRAYRSFHGLTTGDDLPFVLLPAPVDLHASDDQATALIREIRHWALTFPVPLELVVIDTLSAATPGANENASEDMSRVLARCARIAEETHAHVCLVHHMNAEGNRPRGHTSIFANLDNVITVAKLEGLQDADGRQVREAAITKQKDGEDGGSVRFVLPSIAIGTDEDGEEITSCVVAPPNPGALGDELPEEAGKGIKLTPQCEVLLRAIIAALEEDGEPAPASLELPGSTRVVAWERVREAFEKMSFEADREVDPERRRTAIRKAMSRHGSTLLSRRVIGRDKRFIWLTGRKVRGFRIPAVHPGSAAPARQYRDDDDDPNHWSEFR